MINDQALKKARELFMAHRLSAHLFLGLNLEDRKEQANHHSDICPYRHCFNPDHIYIGDQKQNFADMVRDGKFQNPQTMKTHCPKGHPLPDGRLHKQGYMVRDCQICHKLRSRRRREKRVAYALLLACA